MFLRAPLSLKPFLNSVGSTGLHDKTSHSAVSFFLSLFCFTVIGSLNAQKSIFASFNSDTTSCIISSKWITASRKWQTGNLTVVSHSHSGHSKWQQMLHGEFLREFRVSLLCSHLCISVANCWPLRMRISSKWTTITHSLVNFAESCQSIFTVRVTHLQTCLNEERATRNTAFDWCPMWEDVGNLLKSPENHSFYLHTTEISRTCIN